MIQIYPLKGVRKFFVYSHFNLSKTVKSNSIIIINSVCIYHKETFPICLLGLSSVLNSIIIGKFNLNYYLMQIIILNDFNFTLNWCIVSTCNNSIDSNCEI